jgi:hypothetical protein
MSLHTRAQTVVITDDATYTTGQASSVLDVKSTTKGMLVPRVTQAQRLAISSPADGLLVYQTDQTTKGFYYYNSTSSAWTGITSNASNNTLTGNTVLNGTLQVGSNGSTLNSIIKTSFSFTSATSFNYTTILTTTVAVPNATVGAVVHVSPNTVLPTPLYIAYAYISSAGNLTLVIGNSSNTAVSLGTVTFNAIIFN